MHTNASIPRASRFLLTTRTPQMHAVRQGEAMVTRRGGRKMAEECKVRAESTQSPLHIPSTDGTIKRKEQNPQRFAVRSNLSSIGTGSLASLLRLGSGAFVVGYSVSMKSDTASEYAIARAVGRMLRESTSQRSNLVHATDRSSLPVLYEFSGCPFCAIVREACSALDLDVLVKPTPQNGPTFRPEAEQLGGKQQFPMLVDGDTVMYESADIAAYLAEKCGIGSLNWQLQLPGGKSPLAAAPSVLMRGGAGRKYEQAKKADQPLKLWGYEASPFVRIVREKLCSLELPYVYVNTARGSPKRQDFYETLGMFQVPYIEVRLSKRHWHCMPLP